MAPAKKEKNQISEEVYPGVIESIVGNASSKGGVLQVRVKVTKGQDANKIITRNVKGPVKVGDILMMTETEYEARRIFQKQKGNKKW